MQALHSGPFLPVATGGYPASDTGRRTISPREAFPYTDDSF
jgi:hypothetical protein